MVCLNTPRHPTTPQYNIFGLTSFTPDSDKVIRDTKTIVRLNTQRHKKKHEKRCFIFDKFKPREHANTPTQYFIMTKDNSKLKKKN